MLNINFFPNWAKERRVFQKPEETRGKIHGILHPIEIQNKDGIAVVSKEGAILDKNGLDLPPLVVSVEKQAHPKIIAGKKYTEYGMHASGILDIEFSEIMRKILSEAQELRDLPEMERIQQLIKLIHRYLKYAFPKDLDNLGEDKKSWIENNIIRMNSPHVSEILQHGYGICRHFSFIFMWLAQALNIPVCFQGGSVQNVLRKDTNLPLFRTIGIGESSGHAWVEVFTKEGWIRVDPTTQIIEDTGNQESIFTDAKYTPNSMSGILDIQISGDFDGKITPSIKTKVENPGSPNQTFEVEFKRKQISKMWTSKKTEEIDIGAKEGGVNNITGNFSCELSIYPDSEGRKSNFSVKIS